MPDKPQTPKPPRRVQAPKQRATPRTPDEQRTWRTMLIIGALGFLGLAAALAFVFFGRGGGEEALASAGCTVQTFPGQGQDHVEELPDGFEYNSTPPTTGPHIPVPAPFDFYDEPVDPLRLVHNQEHGGVVLHYGNVGDGPDRGDPRVVARRPERDRRQPAPSLGTGIALTAWNADLAGANQEATDQRGILAKCPRFDAGRGDAPSSTSTASGAPSGSTARCSRRAASPRRVPGEGVEPSRPESRPILSRVRLTSSATPARPSMVAPAPPGLTTLSA